jgi:hypothetical protein
VFVSGQGKRGKVWVLNLFWTWILHGQAHQKMLILEQKRRCKWIRKKLKNEFKTRVPNGSKIRKKSEYKPGAKWSKNSKKQ